MKIIIYSDLHLEFGTNFKPAIDNQADLMILAGDIINFRNYKPLRYLLKNWNKPILYISGNHEYYASKPMASEEDKFRSWLEKNHPNVTFLQNETIMIDGVHFFGGTMWTNFANSNLSAMVTAQQQMNDFRQILFSPGLLLTTDDTVGLHEKFVTTIEKWFANDLVGPRVIISHHAPVLNPNTKYTNSAITPAFNSLDMLDTIERYQPDLWIYGHTHECDDQYVGKTRIISNQLGYPNPKGGFECNNFDKMGKLTEILI